MRLLRPITILVLSGLLGLATQSFAASIDTIIKSKHRSVELKTLDKEGHPKEALQFIGVKPNQNVIEIWPDQGWLTEILGPYLKDHGVFTTAVEPDTSAERTERRRLILNKIADDADRLGETKLITFDPVKTDIRPVGGVDLVLTTGNVNTWVAENNIEPAFKAFYRALKSGGTLGILNASDNKEATLQYAKAAGFIPAGHKLIGKQLALRFIKPKDAPVPDDVVRSVREDDAPSVQ